MNQASCGRRNVGAADAAACARDAAGENSRLASCRSKRASGLDPRFNHATGNYERDRHNDPFTGVIVGARADEEGSRSKERYFSPRNVESTWDIAEQPPEFWNQFKADFAPGTHVRIHPLLDWTELNIWDYIEREAIPVVDLYFDRGEGTRYRSLGCTPCTSPVTSTATCVTDIIVELRSGRFCAHRRTRRARTGRR